MAIITYPLNNIEYTAEDAELYHATRTSGVFANDDFPITVSGDGNVVTIGEGIGWIRNSKFSGKVVANKAEMSLDLGLPHATYPRIDAVVLQFNANANASEIIVKNGTAQTNPMPPEVIRTESVYELHLYHVYREAGAASITASNVTDLRSDSAYCGIMSDDVTMLGDDYVRKDMVGVANGVASLDGSGKVPEAQLPSMNYIQTSEKGTANGVAPLNANKRIEHTYLPVHVLNYNRKQIVSGYRSLGFSTNGASSGTIFLEGTTSNVPGRGYDCIGLSAVLVTADNHVYAIGSSIPGDGVFDCSLIRSDTAWSAQINLQGFDFSSGIATAYIKAEFIQK